MIGSGWLFAPLFAATLAGPASVVAWVLGGVMMLIVALSFAELSAMFPVAGGLGRLPQFSHGNVVGMFIGWIAWVGYVTAAPIEVQALLEYVSNETAFEWLFSGSGSQGDGSPLSMAGIAVALVLLLGLTGLNLLGVRWFERVNTNLTWFKIAVPLIFAAVVIVASFDTTNFTDHGGFAPNGVQGVFSAIAAGGVIFSFIGFRHALDLAGEAKNPGRNVPWALITAIAIATVVFVTVQVAFIGGLDSSELTGGWSSINFDGGNGPVVELALALGLTWMAKLVFLDAIVAPVGAGLVSTASTSRLAVAVSRNGLFPTGIQQLSDLGVPARALWLNFLVASIAFFTRSGWDEIVTFNTGAIAVSFCIGPVSAYALRGRLPDQPRPFRLRHPHFIPLLGFVIVSEVVYWTGWHTLVRITIPVVIGVVLFTWRVLSVRERRQSLDLREARWLPVYYLGLLAISWSGNFGGGRGWLPLHWDSVGVAVFGGVMFHLLARSALPVDKIRAYVGQEESAADEDLEEVATASIEDR